MYTTFSSKPQQAAVHTHTNTAPRLPPDYNRHSAKVPSGNSWAGSHRSDRDVTLKSRNRIQVVDLTGDEKSYEPRAGYDHHARDGNNNDIKDLPSLEQSLRKGKWETALSPKQKTGERIHNSNPTERSGPKSPNNKNNYPSHSQKGQFHRTPDPTTQGAREGPIRANGSAAISHGHPNNSRRQTRESHTESAPTVEILAGTNGKLVQKTMKLNPLPATTERVHDGSLDDDSADIDSNRLGKNQDKRMIQDGDDGNRPIVDGEVRHAIQTNGGPGTCDHLGRVVNSGENPSSKPTSDVHNQTKRGDIGNGHEGNDIRTVDRDGTTNIEPARSPRDRACTHSSPHDKTANETQNDDGNVCRIVRSPSERICNIPSGPTKLINKEWVNGEAEKLTSSHNNPLHSHAEERVTDKALKENTFSDVCAGSPTEVASDEGADDEFEKRQDDELQQKPPAFEKASDTDHPRIPVSLPGSPLEENGTVGTRKRLAQTASQSKPKTL
ncbi:hypothetical protein DM02DRAFT_367430 [Periconia macrospinosa]|uniref:Uncharacterized protein n=1 Tax=Periconia macrospinosa TaxID=97972 RepID=A0A2V1D105_9PLEO|nr:hypothetical protein DM02DRAFT_367430 [Periconia macrospinosa]